MSCHCHDHEHEHNHEHHHHEEHDHGGHCCCHGHDHDHEHGEEEGGLKKIIVAAGLFVVALLLERIPGAERAFTSRLSDVAQAPEIFNAAKLLLFAAAYLLCGKDVLISSIKNISRGQIFDEQFLMAVASIAAIAIGEYPEAVAVMLFYQVGEWFEDYAVDKSRDSIQSLVGLRPDKAFVLRDGAFVQVAPEEVQVGDTIQVKPGERVPLDGVVIEGNGRLCKPAGLDNR